MAARIWGVGRVTVSERRSMMGVNSLLPSRNKATGHRMILEVWTITAQPDGLTDRKFPQHDKCNDNRANAIDPGAPLLKLLVIHHDSLPSSYSLFPIPCFYGILSIGSSITGVRWPFFTA